MSVVGIYYLLFSVLFVRLLYNCIEKGDSFIEAFLIILVFSLCHNLLHWFETWYNDYYSPLTKSKINKYMFSKVIEKSLQLEYSEFDNPKFFDEYTRALDESEYRSDVIIGNLQRIFSTILILITAVILVINIDPFLLILAFLGPVVSALLFGKQQNKLSFNLNQEETKFNRIIDYSKRVFFTDKYAREIRVSKIENLIYKQYSKAVNDKYKTTKKYIFKKCFYSIIGEATSLFSIQFIAMFYITYKIVIRHELNVADYIAVVSAIGNINYRTGSLFKDIVDLGTQEMLAENFRAFLNKKPQNRTGKLKLCEIKTIEFKNVSFSYKGSKENAIKNVNFKINKGEKVAIVGQNGSGKTTIVKLILRLYEPTNGEILINDINANKYDFESYINEFVTIFQDYKLFALNIAHNVKMDIAEEKDTKNIENALKEAEFKNKYKNGINTVISKEYDENGIVLSGGQSQKIALSRAFYKQAQVVLLDEPSSALDPISEYKTYENMMKSGENKTIISVSHRLTSTVNSDKIIVLDKGQINDIDSHTKLIEKNGIYKNMYQKQSIKS